MSSINFNSLNLSGNGSTDRQLVDHLFMLKEQLEYTLSNLDSTNFNYKFFDELTVRVQNGLNIQGVVTFDALANNDSTLINGAYIKTGIIDASIFRTYADPTYDSKNNINGAKTSGQIEMYYRDWSGTLLAGSLKMDYDGADTENEALFRVILSTENIQDSNFKVALKLISGYRASFEACEQLYIFCDKAQWDSGKITIRASDNGSSRGRISIEANNIILGNKGEESVIKVYGSLYVNDVKIE